MTPEIVAQVVAGALRQFGCEAVILAPDEITEPSRYLGVTGPRGEQYSITINPTE